MCSTSGPTTAGAWRTGQPVSSASRRVTGAIENRGSRPSGRPRCDTSTSRASCSRRSLERRQRGADARVVGDRARLAVALERHVEVDPHERAAPVEPDVADRLLRERRACRAGNCHLVLGERGLRGADLLGQLDQPARVAPLVVVPGDHLHERAVGDHRELRVEHRRVGRLVDVGRDDRVVRVVDDPLVAALCRTGPRTAR